MDDGGSPHNSELSAVNARPGRALGVHLLVDLYGGRLLDDLAFVEKTLRECADAAGATIREFYIQPFTPNDGISAVAVLAESHLSLHTWPEAAFAAFDAFMCGTARPEHCIPVLQARFTPQRMVTSEHRRGLKSGPDQIAAE